MSNFTNFVSMFADKILATLGEGTFGKVVKVKELNTWVKKNYFLKSIHFIVSYMLK